MERPLLSQFPVLCPNDDLERSIRESGLVDLGWRGRQAPIPAVAVRHTRAVAFDE
jgi:hypothetical protein